VAGEADADVGRATAGVLGLPDAVTAGLFDLDGVLTSTAAMHDQAWQVIFDAFLRERAERTGESFVAFDPVADYASNVDGKPRADGVRDTGEADALREHGADIVVSDLAELLDAAGGKAAR
jgi:phosphoglycolate phosphatase-like HAD superfamily hydrolase